MEKHLISLDAPLVDAVRALISLSGKAMTLFAIVCPQFCSKLGGILFASLIGLILARLVMLIFGMYSIAAAWIGAVIFSLYIA